MADPLCVLRGGGDLATGVAWRLTRAGWPVIVLELEQPLVVRRDVALATAVPEAVVEVEGMVGRRVADIAEGLEVARQGDVAVLVSPLLPPTGADVVIDARLAKVNLDTTIDDASLVVGLGPGFTAGLDCHAVIETQRGHRLGRVQWEGSALPNTGIPGEIGGRRAERVLRSPADGEVVWTVELGSRVREAQVMGEVAGQRIVAPFEGLVRGLIAPGTRVSAGTKIGDVDPRLDDRQAGLISDKALAIGGAVLEAVLTWRARA